MFYGDSVEYEFFSECIKKKKTRKREGGTMDSLDIVPRWRNKQNCEGKKNEIDFYVINSLYRVLRKG